MTGGFYKNYMIKKILILFLLASCGYKFPIGLPTKNNLFNKAPDGPPAFQYGWSQGCSTGNSAYTSPFYTSVGSEKFQKDYKLAEENPDYELGWQVGFWYCLRLAERQEGVGRNAYLGL